MIGPNLEAARAFVGGIGSALASTGGRGKSTHGRRGQPITVNTSTWQEQQKGQEQIQSEVGVGGGSSSDC